MDGEEIDIWPTTTAIATIDKSDFPIVILVVCACGFNIGQEVRGIEPFGDRYADQSVVCPECNRTYVATAHYSYSVQEFEP